MFQLTFILQFFSQLLKMISQNFRRRDIGSVLIYNSPSNIFPTVQNNFTKYLKKGYW